MDFGFCEDSNEFVEKDPTGRYARSDEILGGAAVKTVYRASVEVDGVEVAWKQENVEHVSPKQLERLISEARLLKSLKAEYIIKFYDFWIDDEKKNLNLITVIFVSVSLSQYCKKHKGVTTNYEGY
ncbi:SERINE/THREONINE-PROTEIN KINASE WNK WITH NO LYSINE -RELATED [Salix purpurea]|uniref:non-specific serine/threonine protein kinase n=1 Tax=Salix purpurea TaxID=77065 RepID=A0A9Q0Q152_SALPP|nr:SERINE/THREONINE-PROTEIN KINASE WNK WITH NO LYSINE -RELATED [Salix purpurea]